MLVNRTLANVPLVGAFLGIAETAMALAVEGCKKAEDTASRPGLANALAVMEILLAKVPKYLGPSWRRPQSLYAGNKRRGGRDL